MKKSKIMMLAGISAAALAVFTGCGNEITLANESEEIELEASWWGSDERSEYTMEALKDFQKDHPNIRIKMTYGDFTGFELKNDVKMFSNTEADIMQINFSWLDKYQKQGLEFYDLGSLSDVLDLSQYDETELSYGTNDEGKIVALPIAVNAKLVIYNKELYDSYGIDLPKTWDDLYDAAKIMNKDGVYPIDLDDYGIWMACVAYVEQTTGRKVFDDDGNFIFTKKDVEDMIEFYLDLVDKGVVERIPSRDDTHLSDGVYAGTLQWASGAEGYAVKYSDDGSAAQVALPPTMEGAKREGWYVKPATMYAIGSNTEHPKEAAELLSFMVEDKRMALRQKLEKGVPCNDKALKALDENGDLKGIQNDGAQLIQEANYPLMYPSFEADVYQMALRSAIDEVIFGKSSVEQAAKTAREKMVKG